MLASLEALATASPCLAAFRAGASRFPLLAGRFNVLIYTRTGEDLLRNLRIRGAIKGRKEQGRVIVLGLVK